MSSILAGLFGVATGIALGYANSGNRAKRIEQEAERVVMRRFEQPKEVKEKPPPSELSFTWYYNPPRSAFSKISMAMALELEKMGFEVELRPFDQPVVKPKGSIAVVHPLLLTSGAFLRGLSKHHSHIIDIDVADTTHLSDWAVGLLNNPLLDSVIVPSTFSAEALHRSGVINNVAILPHGVSEDFSLPKHPAEDIAEKFKDKVKILWFGLHSPKRKGRDIVEKSLQTLKKRGRDFILIAKISTPYDGRAGFKDIPVYEVSGWLSEQELVSLYDSCDILLHPYRSGAFELNVYEALARGLPVVVTGWGAVLDYVDMRRAYLISPNGADIVFTAGSPSTIHTGFGVEPSLEQTVELLEYVMDNLDYAKKRAEQYRRHYAKRTWKVVAEEFVEIVKDTIGVE